MTMIKDNRGGSFGGKVVRQYLGRCPKCNKRLSFQTVGINKKPYEWVRCLPPNGCGKITVVELEDCQPTRG